MSNQPCSRFRFSWNLAVHSLRPQLPRQLSSFFVVQGGETDVKIYMMVIGLPGLALEMTKFQHSSGSASHANSPEDGSGAVKFSDSGRPGPGRASTIQVQPAPSDR
eukprot:s4828_g2.t1